MIHKYVVIHNWLKYNIHAILRTLLISQEEDYEIQFIKGDKNIADILTKNIKEEIFDNRARTINNVKVKYKIKKR